jgi:hypothetical protein
MLIGQWSADARYGPGAQSDEMMVFKPDGTGRMESWNWRLCSADLFRWEIIESGVLNLIGYRRLQLGKDGEHVVDVASKFRHVGVPFTIAEEDTPRGQRMLVLRLSLPREYPRELGLASRELSGWEDPRF